MESDGHEWRFVVPLGEERRSPGKCEAKSFLQGINEEAGYIIILSSNNS
jgi:hypothetical protein